MMFLNFGVLNEWYGVFEYQYFEYMCVYEFDEGRVVNILKGAIATFDRVLIVF